MHIVYKGKGKMSGSIPLMGVVCELHYVGFIFLLLYYYFFNILVYLFHLYIFLCFDPSICYPFPCLFVSSIYYLAFLSCSILFLHHI